MLLWFGSFTVAVAQADTLWVPYRGGMDLREGIYFDFRAYRLNAPSVPQDRLRDDQGLPVTDFRSTLSKVYFKPDNGPEQAVRVDSLWGFCHNDVIYVNGGSGFYRIGLMGSISHLVVEQRYVYTDPYGLGYPYGSQTRTAMVHQLLDMETGAMLPFNAAGMDRALRQDPVLLEEFRALPKKQRNSDAALFRFLRLYNERRPLLFPE